MDIKREILLISSLWQKYMKLKETEGQAESLQKEIATLRADCKTILESIPASCFDKDKLAEFKKELGV